MIFGNNAEIRKRPFPFAVCHNKIHGYYGAIESPNFPYKYEHNLNCSWIIDAPIGNKINLTFSHIDLEGSGVKDLCEFDYLEVKEGMYDEPTTELAKICDSENAPRKIHSSKHQVFVTFVTDSLLAFNGFRLEWLVDGCGGHLTRPFDSFTSPGYPSAYPENVECEWLIETDYSHSIELTIHDVGTRTTVPFFFKKRLIFHRGCSIFRSTRRNSRVVTSTSWRFSVARTQMHQS